MAAKRITINSLFEITTCQAIKMSPTGKYAVLTMRRANVAKQRNEHTLWLWRAEDDSVEQLTKGPNDGNAAWIDKHTVVFTGKDREEDEKKTDKPFAKSRLYTISARGGEARLRATLDGAVLDVRPSPDGERLALSYVPNPEAVKKQLDAWEHCQRPHVIESLLFKMDGMGWLGDSLPGIYTVRVKKGEWGEPRKVIDDPMMWEGDVKWLPDGKSFVFRRYNPQNMLVDVRLVRGDLKGRTEDLAAPVGPISSFAVSPDGKHVAFGGNGDPLMGGSKPLNLGICSTNPKDREYRWLCETDGNFGACDIISDITPSFGGALGWQDDKTIISQHAVHGHCELVQVKTEDGSKDVMAGEAGVVFTFDTAGESIIYAHAHPGNPGEIYRLGRPAALTKLNAKVAKQFDVKPRRWFVESTEDSRVDSYLWATDKQLKAKSERSLPLIIYVHGGPAAQAGDVPFHEYVWLAHEGYAVLTGNPRGSTGYGAAHGTGIWGNWGERDVLDVLAMTDSVLEKHPQFDPDRTFICGGSYGGWMTLMMLTRHPGKYRAGVAQRCVSNYISMAGTSDIGPRIIQYATGLKTLWEDPQKTWEMSPISKIADVSDPLLIKHSEGDLRCPLGQAEEVYHALRGLGKKVNEDVRLVVFHGDSHDLSRGGKPENRKARLEEILAWIKKHDRKRE